MLEFIQNFHFLRPYVLVLLIPVLFFYLKKKHFGQQISSWEDICDKHLLKFLLVKDSSLRKINFNKFIFTGLISAIIASSGPCWKKQEIPSFVVENPNMFVLSLAQDMELTDISPSRLNRAKFVISDIIQDISQGQFGLEVYSQEPYVVSPITDDKELIKNILPQVVTDIVPDNGDRLDRAIDLALQRFRLAQYTKGNVIILTSDVGQRFDLAIEKIKEANKNNYTINIIDMSFNGNEKLKLLSEYGNGLYLHIRNMNLQSLVQKLSDINQNETLLSQNTRSNFIDYGYYLVFIPLMCMLVFFRKGALVLFFLVPFSAHAGFFTNDNQEALALFNQEKYEEASAKFTDLNWKGISFYKQDKLEEALKMFENIKTADGFYNKGVVLTKLCKYPEAIEAFDKSLVLEPKNEDAIYNKKVIKELLDRAKENKELLDCNNQQEQQQNEQQENKQEQKNNDNKQQNQNNNEQQNNDNQQADNKSQNNDNQQNNQSDDKNNQEKENDKSSNDEQKNDNQQKESPQEDSQEKENDKKDSKDKANQDKGPENKSKNSDGNENNAQEEQKEEQEVTQVNAKQSDNDEKYDEEALAMQRRYRNIPEDVGGLLREFIKKEYMKDRYNEEK